MGLVKFDKILGTIREDDLAGLGPIFNVKGTWNATTNTPTLVSGVGTAGDIYIVNVAGSTDLDGETDWNIGDEVFFDGTAWQKIGGIALWNRVGTTLSPTNSGDDLVTTGKIGINKQVPLASLDVVGGNVRSIVAKAADYTITSDDYTIIADGTSNTVTLSLPASPNEGQIFNIKCKDSTFTVTIDRNGKNIDGDASDFEIVEDESVTLQYDGTEWLIL